MLVNFFQGLKDGGVPVTPRELLDLLAAMNKQLVFGSIDDFYNPGSYTHLTLPTSVPV